MEEKVKRTKYDGVKFENSHVENFRGRLAISFLEKHAMLACQEDGEDSTGRQKGKIMSVPDMVARACDLADCMVNEITKRNWWLEIENTKELP